MPGPLDDDAIWEVLANGDVAALECAAVLTPAFPFGADRLPSPRHWIGNAIEGGSRLAIGWMLEKGVDLHYTDGEGGTVLHICLDAIRPDKHEVLAGLIQAGADIDRRGHNDWTPLHMAGARGDLEAIAILMAAGADPVLRTRIDLYATPAEEAAMLGKAAAAALIERLSKSP